MLKVVAHPLLDLRAFISDFPLPIGEMKSPESVSSLRSLDSAAPLRVDESIKPRVRELLRFGGYKPTGRGKPASEYLRQAVEKGRLSAINLPVDTCNVVSLHSGLPISVIDLDRTKPPMRISIAPPESEYVFNSAGQTIKFDGLLCLFDSQGPCANGVKDSQRTKTSDSTTRTLSIIWGTQALPDRSETTMGWYRDLLSSTGVETRHIEISREPVN